MLIEFKVANFRSFRDEQTFSMVASRDSAHPDSLISHDGFSAVKTAAVYGANASGKSNLIKALRAMRQFVLASATEMNLGDNIGFFSPFQLDSATRSEPSRLEISTLIDGTTYVYGFSATTERVCSEWLRVRRPNGRLVTWLERQWDATAQQTEWQVKGPLASDAELLKSKTRDNGLLLSRGAELNVQPLAPLFLWFRTKFSVLDMSVSPTGITRETARRISKDAGLRSRVVELMHDADFGIGGLDVAEEPFQIIAPDDASGDQREFLSDFETGLKKLIGTERITKLRVAAEHPVSGTGESVRFSLEQDESNGTQRFFALTGPILDALAAGSLLVVDELDCSMHPHLTRRLVELFLSCEFNPNGAQLVFATHDSSVMDSSLLRRDQIWLTEKRPDGSTELFSLFDFDASTRPRKGEALERNYLAGRYGAVPRFGPALEGLVVP